jgi:hemolysin activation/secretion protein
MDNRVTAEREWKKDALAPTKLESELSFYIPIPNHSTLAFRAGGAHLFGNFEFYRANTLGGQDVEREGGNLRGYLRGQYAGRSAVYFNTDLRIKLISFRTYLFPARFGVLGFYDQGRVWADGEKSNTWHSGYGWGLWLNPFGKAIINLTRGISKEEKLYTLNIGFLF